MTARNAISVASSNLMIAARDVAIKAAVMKPTDTTGPKATALSAAVAALESAGNAYGVVAALPIAQQLVPATVPPSAETVLRTSAKAAAIQQSGQPIQRPKSKSQIAQEVANLQAQLARLTGSAATAPVPAATDEADS